MPAVDDNKSVLHCSDCTHWVAPRGHGHAFVAARCRHPKAIDFRETPESDWPPCASLRGHEAVVGLSTIPGSLDAAPSAAGECGESAFWFEPRHGGA